MKYLLSFLLLLNACAPSADVATELDGSSAPESTELTIESEDSIFGEVPELAECIEQKRSQEGVQTSTSILTKSRYANVFEVPCGAAPGTGAYGYPFSLVVEWEAMENTSEGTVERRLDPLVFYERDGDGSFAPVGYVTQAVGYWDERDLSQGYLHLLYKYAGAGQCGMLVTYTSEGWRAPFEFREVRERTCDAEPCEDDSCLEPKNWSLVYSTWN